MADAEAAVDPRLVALGLADEIVIEFPEGTVELDMLDGAPAVGEPQIAPPPPREAVAMEVPSALEPVRTEVPAALEPVRIEVAAPVEPETPPVALRLEPAPVPEPLPESAVLIQTTVVHGMWPRAAELSIEELGLRVSGKRGVDVRWSDVRSIDVRRGRVLVRTKAATVRLALALDSVGAPELSEPFARVLREARGGTLDLQGTAVHELQNAMDDVRDTFEASDDPFIPRALGAALAALTAIMALALPEILAFVTRPPIPANAFVLGGRLASHDPRVLLVALASAAVITSVAARAALGPHATSWARGTLRGWHAARPSPVARLRTAMALVFLHPAAAASLLALAVAVAVPSARSHATIDATRIHVVRPVPLFDRTASWSEVEEIVPLAVSGPEHPHGLAVLVRFTDGATLTTQDLPLRNATDRYFLELTRRWSAPR